MVNKILLFILFLLTTVSFCTSAQETGKATYYGKRMHGRNTASGIRYHNDSLTCAHRTYPFGTLLKVRNKKNDREVIVTVTDRGPFGRRFIIDLSYSAAKEIDMLREGIANVEVSLYTPIEVPFRVEEDLNPHWEEKMAIPNAVCPDAMDPKGSGTKTNLSK
ncbi:rare lipoprotein A [Bacteroides luti]|jgi:rare lipoprotein A|uniref:Probable endolytic peptidoglycan transglycosylase RlpA n=1 Tax=Bacteroides luti TaxID=1297750 RepID=A0A1M5FUZ3_9BACE|nr:septal ring lytic transglycosylase RlpA family protein [Bacteroides luti]SHF95318.1 rare lipoprotein A [Bacteroides luti]